MLTVKLRNTKTAETLILPASYVQVLPRGNDCVVRVGDAEGKCNEYLITNSENEYNIAFVEGNGGATAQIIRPKEGV